MHGENTRSKMEGETMKEKIGFIGLGLMGAPMAARLLNAGYKLFIFNRTKKKAESLISQGAIWCESPGETASQADIVFSMVSDPKALEEIVAGPRGILTGLTKGRIHIDCSTVSPEITKRLFEKYRNEGLYFLHSPVLGGIAQVAEGSLLLFVGGEEKALKRAEAALRCFGSEIWHFERVEQATTMKLLCNSFISGMVIVLAQALVLAKKADIDPRTLLQIIGHSKLNAPTYQAKGGSMIERDFKPKFFTAHLLKDTRLVLDAAKSLGAVMPMSETAEQLFSKAMDLGLAQEDYSAVIKILESRAGVVVK
jgi:3-hydroxyisobutyrate dehydrogenase-like beta-hydroxyacid dehydrogenase